MELREVVRSTDRRWRIGLLNGPNMPNLGNRDKAVYGAISSMGALVKYFRDVCEGLGVELAAEVCSNYEGDILTWIHAEGPQLDGIVANPAGLTAFGEATRHALAEAGCPFVEVHFGNLARTGLQSRFTATAAGLCYGLREHSYAAGLLALVGILDDAA
jgi:3-dehydroquinate dehydratase-2